MILLTAHGTIPDAVQATQMGAFGFLTKPVDKQELLDQIQRALKISGFTDSTEEWRADIITRSAIMEERLAQAHMVAGTDARVLIIGESGTGKELLARAIHKASPRRAKAFVVTSCTGIAEEQIDIELFGADAVHGQGAHAARSKRPTAARCCWTKSAELPRACSRSCCAPCRRKPSVRWARTRRAR